jgi:myo-inositol-1(or 4)-monophosphatase
LPELPHDLAHRRQVAEQAARAAGAVHLKYLSSTIAYEIKTDPRDVLTQADLEAQEAAKAVLRQAFPDEVLVGEEDGLPTDAISNALREGCWLIDPLDGTQSYVHSFPAFTAGIAYVEGEASVVGAIYHAVAGEMFSAARGLGATLNGHATRVAPAKALSESLVGLHIREVGEVAVSQFLRSMGELLPRAHGIRILGCPMLSMAYVACGRLDACAMLSPSKLGPWDLAPAAVVVEEAGGVVSEGMRGSPLKLMDRGIAGASSRALLDEIFQAAGTAA